MNRLHIPRLSKGFFATVMPFRTEEGRGRFDAEGLKRAMQEVFASQESAAGSRRVDYEIYEDAKYAMVALIDELAIVSDWTYRNDWAQEPLELAIFNTNVAGEEFFDRATKLRKLYATSRDDGERDTILGALEIFYTCLECGFKGRHRGGGEGELEAVRKGLLSLLWPEAEMRRGKPFFPEAYEEGGTAERRSRQIGKWPFIVIGVLLAVFILYVFFSMSLGTTARDMEKTVRDRTNEALEAVVEDQPK